MGGMIKRIELVNFMSHEHTVIEPAPGLTVLIGPNNCGKSAVVAALQILCTNDKSTYVMRHDEKQCSVVIETDDGHSIEWRRKTSPSYVIDGKPFDRIKGELPPELHQALRLPRVETSAKPLDIHFGSQKTPIFLLDASGNVAAQFFAASSDALKLIAMQRRHKEQLAERQREKTRLEAEAKKVNGELALLEPVVGLDQQLELSEQAYAELQQAEEYLAGARRASEQLQERTFNEAHWQAAFGVLAPLTPPPPLEPEAPLAETLAALVQAESSLSLAEARSHSLGALTSPPILADERGLAAVIEALQRQTRQADRTSAEHRTLALLPSPPALDKTERLEQLLTQLAGAQRTETRATAADAALVRVAPPPKLISPDELQATLARLQEITATLLAWEQETTAAQAAHAAAASALREAVAGEACPTCGGPLDPDRVLARAAAGTGGHAHG
jgi:exonuclease SbcC